MGLADARSSRGRAPTARDRVPATGGLVYAINHMHWIDVPLVGVVSPRNIDFVAKAEAVNLPGVGQLPALARHDRGAPRRVRPRRRAPDARVGARRSRRRPLRRGHAPDDSGRPGTAQPGAAMVAMQEDVPVVPVAIYGTQFWKARRLSRRARSRSASRCASRGCRRAARATRRRPSRSSGASTCSSTGWPTCTRSGRPERSDAAGMSEPTEPPIELQGTVAIVGFPNVGKSTLDQPAHRRRARRSCTRRRARRATARS